MIPNSKFWPVKSMILSNSMFWPVHFFLMVSYFLSVDSISLEIEIDCDVRMDQYFHVNAFTK